MGIRAIQRNIRDRAVLAVLLLVSCGLAYADPLGGESPCLSCSNSASDDSTDASAPGGYAGGGGSALSLTEGNLIDSVPVVSTRNGTGTTLNLALTYNSYLADSSQGGVTTVLGRGWTHTYNIFLIEYRRNIFKVSASGRTTKYSYAGTGYIPDKGHFDTLTKNPGNIFTLRTKGGTEYTFKQISPPPPYYVQAVPYVLTSIEDRNGNVTLLTYANGLLSQVADAWGRVISFTYNSDKKIATVTDPLGRVTTFQYTGAGSTRLSGVTDPDGHTVSYAYNTAIQVTSKTDKDGKIFTYLYNAAKKPYAVKDGSGNVLFSLANAANWAINQSDLLRVQERNYTPSTTSQTDGNGNVWQYSYNDDGYITSATTPASATTTYTYDPVSRRLVTKTDPLGRVTQYQYDSKGNVIQETDPLGQITTYTYDPVYSRRTGMTDSNGHVTTYVYDAQGNRIQETDAAGGIQAWSYDSQGNVLTETDKNGHVTTYAYDAVGNRISTTDALGNATTYTYDAVGNLVSQTDSLSHTTTYTYDAMNRLVTTTDPLLHVQTTAYDGNGNVSQTTDFNGNTTTYQYHNRDRLTTTTNPLGDQTHLTYDGNGNVLTRTNENGFTTTYTYDSVNRLTQTVEPNGATTTAAYDAADNRTSHSDPNGHTTIYDYDGLDRVVEVVDALGGTTHYEYDGAGGCCGAGGKDLVTKRTDANGKVTYYEYDALYRLARETRKEGDVLPAPDATDATTTFTYDANGNRLTMTDPAGNATSYSYDAVDRLVTFTNGAGETSAYAYDAAGNVSAAATPGANLFTYTYDALNRPVTTTDFAGPVSSYTYDANGNVLTQTDGNGNTSTFTYDALDRIVTTGDALGNATTYSYDPIGNRIATTDRTGQTTTFVYDSVDRLVSLTDPLGNPTTYAYDLDGNLLSVTDANSHTTSYTYDGLDRRATETYADGGVVAFTYDAVGNLLTRTDPLGQTIAYVYDDLYYLERRDFPLSDDDAYTYDRAGKVLTATRGAWIVTYTYDGANRVTQTVQDGETVDYAYNALGRTRTIVYPSGRVITEQYDVRERLESVEDPLSLTPIGTYTYDAGNRIVSRASRNGVTAAYSYNANGYPTTIDHNIGLTRIEGYTYQYDAEGHAIAKEDLRVPLNSEAYQYDVAHRLINFDEGLLAGAVIPAPTNTDSYSLDGVGNWDSVTRGGVPELRTHSTTNEIVTMAGNPMVHSAAGDLVEDPDYQYFYDELHRLIAVTRKSDLQTVAAYIYDAVGRRVVRLAQPILLGPVTITRFIYDESRAIEEQDVAATPVATYVYGQYLDEPLTMDRGGATYYYHQNALWSTVALTDAAGAVVERYAYDAYGCPVVSDAFDVPVPPNPWFTEDSVVDNPYLYTGRRYDEETGLYHYRARAYDCTKGRFLQRDALGYIDGMNLYEYARSNPISYVDANGQYAVSIPKTKGKNSVTKAEFQWVIQALDWSRWGQLGGTWYDALPGLGKHNYNGTLDNAQLAWATVGVRGDVSANNPKKFESVQLTPFTSGGTSAGSSWTNSDYNWTVQKSNIKGESSTDGNGEECYIVTGNVNLIDGNAKTIGSEFSVNGKVAAGGANGAPGAEVGVGFTYSETVAVNVTRTSYSASFKQKICACGAADSDLFDFRKFGPRKDRFGLTYPWYHDISVTVENSEQKKPLNKTGMW